MHTATSTAGGETAGGENNGEMERGDAKQDKPPSLTVRISPVPNLETTLAGGCLTAVIDSPPPDETTGGSLGKSPRFPQSPRSLAFRKRFFPAASHSDWNNWNWQLANSRQTAAKLDYIFKLDPKERLAMTGAAGGLPTAITPYYSSLIPPEIPDHPLRRSMIPTLAELSAGPGEREDPLGEEAQSPIPGLVHRYPDRVLFMATEYCAAYCRYCTRSRLVGQRKRLRFCRGHWERALEYIRTNPAIRDVIVSGGDPLTLPDEPLEWLLMNLRAIRHVEIIRLGSKTPAVLPMRITPALIKLLRRINPLWLSLHFTHPDELTPETAEACSRLADAGFPLGSQTVLLRGVNDEIQILRRLFTGLMRLRVRPYYLYQCDPIIGGGHFRAPVVKGLEIIQALRGHISGYAIPHYVIDAPGGGGKIPLLPNCLEGRDGGELLLRNYRGNLYRYPDPECNSGTGEVESPSPGESFPDITA
ncbi:MAG: KamA family radical SAM protein [Planctomycetota bacterium]|jgi:lysine 2,3-aminomutase|nr:KamA family radical SAM protein [Planctomycetota bacterium]